MFPKRVVNSCGLSTIVFPRITDASTSSFRVITPREALPLLLAETKGWFLPEPSRMQFEFNCDLVTTVPAVEAHLSRDCGEWTAALEKALDAIS
jgi:hypothetical protein